MLRKLLAEFIGTFILATTVILSVSGTFIIPTPILAGLVLFLFVFTIGGISGCHINPAVTLGLLSIRKIKLFAAIQYIVAQVLGGIAAILVTQGQITFTPIPSIPMENYYFELIGMAVFAFSIGTVVFDEKKSVFSGFIIGGGLLLGISLSVMGGAAGILNPAVAIALQTMDVGYYIAQIIGSVIGFQLYAFLIATVKHKK